MWNGFAFGSLGDMNWLSSLNVDVVNLFEYMDPGPMVELMTNAVTGMQQLMRTFLPGNTLDLIKLALILLKQFGSKALLGEVLILTLVFVCTLLFFYYLYRSRGLPPGPWGLPWLGFLPWLDPERPHLTLAELAADYGPICSLRLGEVTAVLLSHPSLVREALGNEVFAGRAPLWLTHGLMNNNGLIAVEGEKWREQRKFIVSCLKNMGIVKIGGKRDQMEKRILEAVKETNRMVEAEQLEKGSVDLHRVLGHNIGNLINSIVFGKTYDVDDVTWNRLQTLAEEGAKVFGVAGIINFIPVLRFLPKYKSIFKFVKDGQVWTHNVYRQIAKERGHCKDNILTMYTEAMKQRKGAYFTEEQMLHVLADLFGAGLDTSLATLKWLFLYLAINPQIQETVYEEIDSTVGKRKHPNLDDMQKCTYTEATILETMRIRPVVPLGIPHGTLEDTTLAGYRIPVGTMIMVNQWALHHDRDHWNEPETFNPARFLAPDGSVKKSEYLNPFQNGKRVCIGEEMARMVLFLFVSGILRTFSVEAEGETEAALRGTPGITLCPGKHTLRFLRREGRAKKEKVLVYREDTDQNV